MQTDKDIPGISCGLVDSNIFEWEVMLMINDDCRFYGGKSIHIVQSATILDILIQCRWLLPCAADVPPRVSIDAAEDEIRDTNFPS